MNDPASSPRIWLVLSDKPGDNAQAEMIAEALGLPYEIRRVLPKPEFVLGKPAFEESLDHLDLARSDRLEAPWPDLIITIGRRPAMAALWIQSRSGGHSRIVLIGRPKRWQARFDLIIVPAQYRVPADPKVLQLDLPLMRSHEQDISAAVSRWREPLDALPRPLTALLIGGPTKPFRMTPQDTGRLLKQARAAAGDGHLYVSSSRRTPPAVVEALARQLPANASLFRWSADATDNPYFALLGLADRFIVTGDSVSMMVEVARLGRPLAIAPLPYRGWSGRLQHWLAGLPRSKLLHRLGLLRYARDLGEIHRLLYTRRLASPLGSPFIEEGRRAPEELERVAARVREVLAS